MEERVESNPMGDYKSGKGPDSGQQATNNNPSNLTSVVVRRQKRTKLDDDEDERNLRRVSYLRATKDLDSDLDDHEEHEEAVMDVKGGAEGGLKQGHSIQKIFAVFSKMVDAPLSPTTSTSKLEDFAAKTPEKEKDVLKEGWLELKINEKFEDKLWKNVFVVLKNNTLYFYRDKTTSKESPLLYEESPLNLNECKSETDQAKKRTILKLRTENGLDYSLQTESEISMNSWIQIVEELTTVKQTRWARRSITSRNRSPTTSQSPVNKTRKPSSEQFQWEKENRKSWKGKVSKQWKKMQGSTAGPLLSYPEGGSIGVPLEECPQNSDYPDQNVPLLVQVCCGIVEERGLTSVGIYRVPGNSAAVMALTEQVNKGAEHFKLDDPRWSDVNVVSSLLKSFFRKLPDPLFTLEMYSVFVEMSKIEDSMKRLNTLKQLVQELPECNFETLKYVCLHLCKIIKNSEFNKMDLRNLAIVFGPTLVRTSDENMLSMVTDMAQQCRIIESILSNCDWFFNSADELKISSELPCAEESELRQEEFKRIVEVTPVTEFTQSGYQSLLLTNLQKLEEAERGLNPNRDLASAKDIMSGIISAANRKMLRNKTKKDSVDTSCSLASDLTRSQLWLDLSESETPTGGSSPALSPRPNLHGAGNLVAAMPHLMGTLVGAHHHSSASNVSTGNSSVSTGNADSHFLGSLSSDNLASLKKSQSKDYLSKSSNCLQTCPAILDQGNDQDKKKSPKKNSNDVLENELAGGILFQEPYSTEAYEDSQLLVPNRFVNLTYLTLSHIPSSIVNRNSPPRETSKSEIDESPIRRSSIEDPEEEECPEKPEPETKTEESETSSGSGSSLLTELTATFDEKLRLLLDPNYQSSSSIQSDTLSATMASQISCVAVQRRKSDLASSLTSLEMSPHQQRSLSLDHGSADCDLIREQLDAISLKQKCKKSDLKRGRLVDKFKEPLVRQRNNSASKPEEIKVVPDHPVLRIKLSCPDSKHVVNRRHTICGILTSRESIFDSCDVIFNEQSLRGKLNGNFSFAKSIQSDDWRTKLRLRSSSPDLIYFNEMSMESLPLSFLSSLLESQV